MYLVQEMISWRCHLPSEKGWSDMNLGIKRDDRVQVYYDFNLRLFKWQCLIEISVKGQSSNQS